MWSINGSPISSANTFTGRSQQILCCCVSEMNEWDMQNVIVTGHSDGVVRVSTSLNYTHFLSGVIFIITGEPNLIPFKFVNVILIRGK